MSINFDRDLAPEITADNGFENVEAEAEVLRSKNLLNFYHIVGNENGAGVYTDDTGSDSEESSSSSDDSESDAYAYTVPQQEMINSHNEDKRCPNPRVSQAWKKLAKSSLAKPSHPLLFQNRQIIRPFESFRQKHKAVYLCKEHLYRATSNSWHKRKVLCRLNLNNPIGEGAMRRCYEIKILRKVSKTDNWCFDFYHRIKLPLQDGLPLLSKEKVEEFYRNHCGSPMPTTALTVEDFLSFFTQNKYDNRLEKLDLVFDDKKDAADCCNRVREYLKDREKFYEHWNSKALDYVAKVYKMQDRPDARNFPLLKWDTKMQEVCKELTLAYNAYNPPPPKSIDMLHMGLIELPQNRKSKGLEHHNFLQYEAFIEGDFTNGTQILAGLMIK
mmetsp:Transcript_24087/g.29477  ORF Transcript_24087/g.29477 Transcript_24087/m.29477 type:complete len:386 (+) Transcript_24087:142-1299(+)